VTTSGLFVDQVVSKISTVRFTVLETTIAPENQWYGWNTLVGGFNPSEKY